MSITELQFKPIKPKDGLIGFISFLYDSKFYMSSIGVFAKDDGTYSLSYPGKKLGTTILQYFHPVSKVAATEIEVEVQKYLDRLLND